MSRQGGRASQQERRHVRQRPVRQHCHLQLRSHPGRRRKRRPWDRGYVAGGGGKRNPRICVGTDPATSRRTTMSVTLSTKIATCASLVTSLRRPPPATLTTSDADAIASWAQGFAPLLKPLVTHGPAPWKWLTVPRDGDCFYSCIGRARQALRGTGDVETGTVLCGFKDATSRKIPTEDIKVLRGFVAGHCGDG